MSRSTRMHKVILLPFPAQLQPVVVDLSSAPVRDGDGGGKDEDEDEGKDEDDDDGDDGDDSNGSSDFAE